MDNDETDAYLLATSVLLLLGAALIRTNNRTSRRWKTRTIYRDRKQSGFYTVTFLKMKSDDPEQFFKYTRMTTMVFDYLLSKLKNKLKRRRISDQICPEEKLAITLQYLSQGVSMQSLAWSYKMGLTTVHKCINEVCRVIWDVLSPEYLSEPTVQDWKDISNDFFNLWNFPNCIGALDGKHVSIQAPPKSGSLFFNYKKNFSIILLACCDAKYIFKLVDIGAYGSQSDGGVCRNSVFGTRLDTQTLNVPEDSIIPNTNIVMPYVLVADEAFPLKRYIMRPYPGKNLSEAQRIFNYRLSRARRVIENAFGIMVARWRIMKQTINAKVENIDHIVKAVVVLHNFCKMTTENLNVYCPPGYADADDKSNGQWRMDTEPLRSVGRLSANTSSRICYQLRDILSHYISTIGALPWQLQRIFQGQETIVFVE